jgi:hypothetical protein
LDAGNRAEADALYEFFPRLSHGTPIQTTPREHVLGDPNEVLRFPTKAESAQFEHRQKMRKKYNSKRRPDYLTSSTSKERARKKAAGVFDYGEDVGNTFNIERRKHTVGRYRGSVEEYKAKVVSYIKELETELQHLDYGSAKRTRRTIIEDILRDLKAELRKNADQINPTKTGLPHKLELRVIEALKGEGRVLNRMVGDVADLSKKARFIENKIAVSEIANSDFSSLGRVRAAMVKADLMQSNIPEGVIKGHLKDKNSMERYMRGDRIDELVMREDGMLDYRYPRTVKDVRLRGPEGRIKVGRQVMEDRRAQREAERAQAKQQMRLDRIAQREAEKQALEESRKSYVPSFVRRLESINQASASISSSPMPGSSAVAGATDSTTRAGSRVAEMLGQDTVRAASVIHSSKLSYAAVGLAGMAAVFGIASAGRQRKNMEQEIQSRI